MDPRREEELLLHIAAGTDPLTALAALPRESEQNSSQEQPSTHRNSGWVAIALLIAIVALLLIR